MIDRETALSFAESSDLDSLMAQASAIRDSAYPGTVSYSRKVFIPLTQLCRDVCHYCTFAHAPRNLQQAYLSPEQVLDVARAGQAGRLQGGAVHPRR